MKITKEDFIKSVKQEIRLLRKNMTPKEAANMNIENFDPDHGKYCIYGQATGDCYSRRALFLIQKCCKRVVANPRMAIHEFSDILNKVNGPNRDHIEKSLYGTRDNLSYLSALEGYILTPKAKNANVIAYLKGKSNSLEL